MQKPNWFDAAFDNVMKDVSAEEALAMIANTPRVVKAVTDALADHDAHAGQQGWAGPSRTQAVRDAIAQVLQAD